MSFLCVFLYWFLLFFLYWYCVGPTCDLTQVGIMEKFSTLYEDIYLDAPFCHCVCCDQLVPLLRLELHFCQL
jgi:hypothetical protein